MSAWIKPLKRLLAHDWFLALLLLGIYLATNRYVYGWDDQHLEIPLLKRLIDPALYPGDYYVDSLQQNFTSYLYPILSKLISVDQVPAAYLFLFLVSRFFFFFFSFKLWDLLARKYFAGHELSPKFAAFCAVASSILIGRVEEFLYRTFSHQEFAFAIIFAAVYYFYKDRFILAALLFGIAANFHALYALFPMVYMSVYLLFFHQERRVILFVKTGLTFVLACSPFLLWAIPKNLQLHGNNLSDLTQNWIAMYYLACPQNFPFGQANVAVVMGNLKLLVTNLNFLTVLVLLYIFQLIFNEQFRRDRKIQSMTLTVAVLIFASFYFAYVHPMRFALDLNLIRNEQYLRFLLMGYTSLFIVYKVGEKNVVSALLLAVIFMFSWSRGPFGACILAGSILILTIKEWKSVLQTWDRWKLTMCAAFLVLIVGATFAGIDVPNIRWDKFTVNALSLSVLIVCALIEWKGKRRFRKAFVAVPLMMAFLFFCYYHYQFIQVSTKGGGFWQLQRNWEAMAHYVKDNTPKDAYVMTPYNTEMGGFRIHSERKLLVSYRDCGIIGFDYKAALEWRQRIKDVEPFKVITDPQSIAPAIVNALYKYKVDYIVFMRYYAPEDNVLVQKIYENEVFALYKVNK